MKKIHCVFHQEFTASLAIYPDEGRYICFGCGRKGSLKDLPPDAVDGLEIIDFLPKPKENLEVSIHRIRSLPKKLIRGLNLHYDDKSYYLVWPDGNYYLRRFTDEYANPKYVGPVGHDRPIFQPWIVRDSTCIVVEGELNAASIAKVYDGNVLSLGSATNFKPARLKTKYLDHLNRYDKILLILDADPAGTLAGIEACAYLKSEGIHAVLDLWDSDANKLLGGSIDGEQKVRAKVEEGIRRLLEEMPRKR